MLTPGTILIARDAPHPACFELGNEPYPDDWAPVTHRLPPQELERKLGVDGWTFFYLANSITRTAFGAGRAHMLNSALKRVIDAVKQEGCNCVEIDQIDTHSFLRIPCLSISAHPRHIQKGMVFTGK